MQYIRGNYKENISKLPFVLKPFYQLATLYLRPWDKKKRTYNKVYFNSEYTKEISEHMYRIHGEVKYPPIDKAFHTLPVYNEVHNYFIFVGRIVKYVREIDKIIRLFNNVWEHLIIVWDGPDMWYAQSIAWPTVIFTGRIDDVEEKKKLLQHARWYINLAKESFGIGTAEALCSGVPIFGYTGWATGYMVDNNNGYLVEEKNDEKIVDGFKQFVKMSFDRKKIAEEAQKKFFW